ncbi:MAG TPA: hypothetical protein VML53_01175 [Thermoplasmata archaeon]|nr:hypothetical protein [Thermoplasmata archaeon]
MSRGHFRADLGLVRQGVHLAWEYGTRPLEELTRLAELLEHSVYERGSLVASEGSVRFTLLNPPLRMGAFSRIGLAWDGIAVDASQVRIGTDPGGAVRTLASITRDAPATLPIGARSRFSFPVSGPVAGVHAVRLELHSAAIPPTVWLEFSDRVGASP